MVMDILLPYERMLQRNITYNDLTDGEYIRDNLDFFKKDETKNSTTKLKHVTNFKVFLEFIITDICSPERNKNETSEQILLRGIRLKEVIQQLDITTSALSKNRGKDLIKTSKRSKNKLIEQHEIDEVRESEQHELEKVLDDDRNGKLKDYKIGDAIKVSIYVFIK